MNVENIFELHGKWYENNENRITSCFLFFLNESKTILLRQLIKLAFPKLSISGPELLNAKIDFQPHISGKIPDAEILFKKKKIRILIEVKIGGNSIDKSQLVEYAKRLHETKGLFPNPKLLVITQINEKLNVSKIAKDIEKMGYLHATDVYYLQWKKILDLFKNVIDYDKLDKIDILVKKGEKVDYLPRIMQLFIKEVERTMYNRIEISKLPLEELDEVVLTTQDDNFMDMAINDNVFWPSVNFAPSQFVAYYGLASNKLFSPKKISYIARVQYLFHNVTINELPTIPQFSKLSTFKSFLKKAHKLYSPGSPNPFAIAITEDPIPLSNPIPYIYKKVYRLNPRIIPGRKTTLSKIITAKCMEDLY